MAARAVVTSVIALVLLLAAGPASAVIVELKSGQRVEGALRQASATRVLLESGGQILVFDTDDVRAIYFSPPPPAAPAPPPAGSVPPPAAPAATPPAPAPGAAPPAPPQVSPAVDALEIMKALRASVAGGTSPLEYGPRVGEARVAVERYFASLPDTVPPGGEALREAVRYYQIADFAWRNHSIASDTVWLQRDDILDRCPRYRDFAQAMQAKGEPHYSERTRIFLLISDGVLAVLWSCAADRVGEAEQAFPKVGKK